jgi:hypothetical protein
MENIEVKKLRIEHWRMGLDFFKWLVGGIVIIMGFMMIRPHEQERLDKALQLEVNKAYLSATDTENIDLWQRKLNLLKAISNLKDKRIQAFIKTEQETINEIREHKGKIRVASQQKIAVTRDIEAARKQYAEIKTKYESLAQEQSQEKKRVAEDKLVLEYRIAKLESLQKQASKQEQESAKKLTSLGIGIVASVTSEQRFGVNVHKNETVPALGNLTIFVQDIRVDETSGRPVVDGAFTAPGQKIKQFASTKAGSCFSYAGYAITVKSIANDSVNFDIVSGRPCR